MKASPIKTLRSSPFMQVEGGVNGGGNVSEKKTYTKPAKTTTQETNVGSDIADFITPESQGEAILGVLPVGGAGVSKWLTRSKAGKNVLSKVPGLSKLFTPSKIVKNKPIDFSKSRDLSGKVKGGVDAGDVHFKSVADRTVPVRGGKQFNDPVSEYNSLRSMYNEFPENVVRPLSPKFDKSGKLVGYNMEKIKGVDLDTWMKEGNTLTKDMYDDIASTITKMNSKGIYHGDLKINNIMIDRTGNWKLIDPVGFEHASNMSDKMLKVAQDTDKKGLQQLSKWINK